MRKYLLCLSLLLAACSRPPGPEADVIVIGAGLAGLSAALEASDRGARVLVLEANSVPGGHAVKAGGFALVGTPLQAKKGYVDDPETAFRDLMAWGEDADAAWVRRYVEASGPQVHDWLASFGVTFSFILDTPEHSVPRFHFARGAAVNVVLPLVRELLARDGIELRLNQEVSALLREDGRVTGARMRDLRSGEERIARAGAVVIATGGAQADLEQVRANWRADLPEPERLYVGAGQFATGAGLELARAAGAGLSRLDHQVTFSTGLPDPRDPSGRRGLLTQNAAAIWVDATGRRFIAENAPSKVADDAVLAMSPATHWLVFDARGLRSLRIRDAVWLDERTRRAEILDNPALVQQADDLTTLAERSGLPAQELAATVARYNALVAAGLDSDFGRFGPDTPDPSATRIETPPFYAIRLYPLTRKNMGGIAIDREAHALDDGGNQVTGLYAAGEATGVAGINGRYGGEGTFLGPSVFIGRLAGRSAARAVLGETDATSAPLRASSERRLTESASPTASESSGSEAASLLDAAALSALLATPRPGYWHFEAAHTIVLERGLDCVECHGAIWPTRTADTRKEKRVQLESCTRCH